MTGQCRSCAPVTVVSLKNRLTVLFIGFAILPVLLLGLGDYLQSVQALRAVIDVRREALAEQTVREIEKGYSRVQQTLRTTGARLADSPERRFEVRPGSPFPFDAIRVMDGSGRTLAFWSADLPRQSGFPCDVESGSSRIRVDGPGTGAIGSVEGVLNIGEFAASVPALTSRLGHDGFTRIVHASTGEVLFDSGCLGREPPGGESSAGEQEAAVANPGPETAESWRQSKAGVAQLDWIVGVYSNDREFLAPFRRSRIFFVGVVFLVLIAAAGIFSILAQSSLRSLRSLIRAADEVQVGNMRPWLPPPGEDEVGRLAMAFRKMTDRLDESIRQSELNQKLAAVGELASYLSHEIRNPLSSIRLGLQTLHRDLSSGFIPPDAHRIIEISLNEVKRLNGVVQTVLEVGRDRGEVDENTVCDVHATIAAAVDVIMPKARSKDVDLDFFPTADTPWVIGDADSLRGVWLNLIVNALDALEGQRGARILISSRQGKDGDLQIRVADNGPGVPPYALDSIFEPFYTTKDQGNGIGLATASATLQSFGGSISYDTQASVDGAVFLIRLKRARSTGSEAVEDAVPAYNAVGTA